MAFGKQNIATGIQGTPRNPGIPVGLMEDLDSGIMSLSDIEDSDVAHAVMNQDQLDNNPLQQGGTAEMKRVLSSPPPVNVPQVPQGGAQQQAFNPPPAPIKPPVPPIASGSDNPLVSGDLDPDASNFDTGSGISPLVEEQGFVPPGSPNMLGEQHATNMVNDPGFLQALIQWLNDPARVQGMTKTVRPE